VQTIESSWIDTFERIFAACRIERGDVVRVLSETQSRRVNVKLAELALARLGARPVHIVVPSRPVDTPVPVRSTGASHVIQHMQPVMNALCGPGLVVDLTVEGLLHAPELAEILGSGARVQMVSNEHPEILERLSRGPDLSGKVKSAVRQLAKAQTMHVSSAAGTDLTIDVSGGRFGGVWGAADRAGLVQHWPAGICLCFPKAGSVNGTLALNVGDVNLTFKRYLESPVRFIIKDDYVTEIIGEGLDAELTRSYLEAWQDRDAYAVSHVGWGLNPNARWDSMAMFDKADFNGTELRAFAGNFLYSTGANENAGRHTLGHFDLPVRNCTVTLDGGPVVVKGVVQESQS
jgi:2,5-dihydroxypyridine 5,6-dioxygenase